MAHSTHLWSQNLLSLVGHTNKCYLTGIHVKLPVLIVETKSSTLEIGLLVAGTRVLWITGFTRGNIQSTSSQCTEPVLMNQGPCEVPAVRIFD